MKIAVLGTGTVGRAHAEKLLQLGHEVVMGTQDISKTIATPPFSEWHEKNKRVVLNTFAAAAAHGEIILEALNGAVAVEVLKSVGKELEGKILIDISNPLDFSKGMPPSLFVCNTESLGERIQSTLPKVRVVKTLNTTNALIQVNPGLLAHGDHHIFISGNDSNAKAQVIDLLKRYGWINILDLGDITTARGTEMLLPVWLRIWSSLQNANFNFKIVAGPKI